MFPRPHTESRTALCGVRPPTSAFPLLQCSFTTFVRFGAVGGGSFLPFHVDAKPRRPRFARKRITALRPSEMERFGATVTIFAAMMAAPVCGASVATPSVDSLAWAALLSGSVENMTNLAYAAPTSARPHPPSSHLQATSPAQPYAMCIAGETSL